MFYSWCFLGPDQMVKVAPGSIDYSPEYVFYVEMLFTFIFNLSIFHIGYPESSMQNDMLIGVVSVIMSLYFGILCAGNYSGACLNATIGLTNTTFAAMTVEGYNIKYIYAYFFGDLLGGIFAGLYYKNFARPFFIKPVMPSAKSEAFYLTNNMDDIADESGESRELLE